MTFLQQLYNALAVGAIYVAVALGITLIYGLTRIVNFAHGQMLTLGAYLTFELVSHGIPYFAAVAITVVSVAAIGELLDLLFFRRTLASPLNGFVVSLGLIITIQSIVVLIWGTEQQRVAPPFAGIFEVGDLIIDKPRLLLLGTISVVVVLLFLFLQRTKAGRGIRALAEDPTAARLVGVPVSPFISLTFVLGSALAALAGGLLAATYSFDAFSGFDFVLKGFAVAIIGGLGSVPGAVIAGLLLALSETIGAAYFSIGWAPAFGLAATALIILVKPSGLFRGAGAGPSHFGLGLLEAQVHAKEAVLRARAGAVGWWRRDPAPKLAVVAVAAVLVAAPAFISTARTLSVVTYMVILMIAAYAFWFPFRFAGIFSMAPGAMMGVGAYAAAISVTRWELGFWLQIAIGFGFAALGALLMGIIALRTSASYFVILTLVLSQLYVLIFANWESLTRGRLGIVTAHGPGTLGPFDFETPDTFYFLVLGFLGVTVSVLFVVSRSHFGRRLVTLRENEPLARSLGVPAFREKLLVFVLFGGISGVAGVLLFHYLRFIEPETFSVYLDDQHPAHRPARRRRGVGRADRGRCVLRPSPRGPRPRPRAVQPRLRAHPPGRHRPAPHGTRRDGQTALRGSEMASQRAVGPRIPRTGPTAAGGAPGRRFVTNRGRTAMNVASPLLEARGLRRRFGGVVAVDNVDIHIGPNEVLGVIGPNGSGKTTLFNLLSGFVRPMSGSITWDGVDITRTSAHRRAHRGLVRTFQESMVFAGLTVRENVDRATDAARLSRRRTPTVDDLLAYTRITHLCRLARRGPVLGPDPAPRHQRRPGDPTPAATARRAVRGTQPRRGRRRVNHHQAATGGWLRVVRDRPRADVPTTDLRPTGGARQRCRPRRWSPD